MTAHSIEDHRWKHDDVVHGYWIAPDRILAGEYPGDSKPDRAKHKLGLLLDAGIRTFVDLTRPDDDLVPYEQHLLETAAERGVEVQRLEHPVPDMGVVDDGAYDVIVDAIHGAVGGAVYVHCPGDIGRTATVVGCLLVDEGHDADAALDRIVELRSATRKADRPAPQTTAQIEVIRRRARRRSSE